jgi:hypothetical protein
MKKVHVLAMAASAAALFAIPASAQNYNARPAYGTLNLNAGFSNDPRSIALQAGGSIDASRLGAGCRGYIAGPPDYRVNYRAGSFPLIFSVRADSDTTLVINGPDGRWYCNDDANGVNPAFRFASPRSGQYDVWVGTYSNSGLRPARLFISELRAQ